VENEVANVMSTEVDTERDAGKCGFSVPERNLDHVEVLAGDSGRRFEIILRFHQKMQLMEVELVVFGRAVLDGPFLDRALGGDDVGGTVGIEHMFWLPFHIHEKRCRLDFIEKHRAPYGDGADPRPAKRGFLVSNAANAATLRSLATSWSSPGLTSLIVARGRCGSLSPNGPVLIASVMSWASRTEAGGAAAMNSTRAAGGSVK
jgi:hypothetical protein